MITGALLALTTFIGGLLVSIALGLPWAAAITGSRSTTILVRHALWWGFLIAGMAAVAINQFAALSSPPAGAALGLLIVGSVSIGVLLLRRRNVVWGVESVSGPTRLYLVALVAVAALLAVRVIGPVTNYDTGLYHLGAIRYAADYAVIPGLANTFFAYGYATTEFPLSALLSWSPLGSDGYRTLNSILILMMGLDLALRFLQREKSAGRYVLAVGSAVVLFTMLPLADYWVISPTQDASALVLVVMASAYLSEALSRRAWVPAAATAIAIAVAAILIRSTMLAFAGTLALVVVTLAIRRRRQVEPGALRRAAMLSASLTVLALSLAAGRDYFLSGWWQYPLSVLPFDVEWRAPDATAERLATLGAARDPANLWEAAQSWTWLGAWWTRALTAWEFYAVISLVLAGVIAVVVAKPPRAVFLALAPSVVASVFWFVLTPPSFRFAWGPLFTIGTVAIGWSTWQASKRYRSINHATVLGVSAVALLAVTITAAIRIDYGAPTQLREARGLPISYSVTPVVEVDAVDVRLPSGLVALVPTDGDQCWARFPLCTPQLRESLRYRGLTLQEGLLP